MNTIKEKLIIANNIQEIEQILETEFNAISYEEKLIALQKITGTKTHFLNHAKNDFYRICEVILNGQLHL